MTLTYSALFTGAGAVMVSAIYLFMRFGVAYALVAAAPQDEGTGTAQPTEHAVDSAAQLAPTNASGSAFILVSDQADILNALLAASLVFLVLLAAASGWIGWIISGRVLQPLQDINRAAQRAAGGRLDHRLAMLGPRDEIRALSDTFDEMLERLDRSFQAHQRFAANASHELRTPLATTQAMIDVALQQPALSVVAVRQLLERLRSTNTRSVETVEALLDLADLGQADAELLTVDLRPLIEDASESVRRAAEMRGITITVRADGPAVLGDSTLLAQAIGNLLTNAVRHNLDGGVVQVDLVTSPLTAQPVLRVENTGAIVAPEAVARFAEPFYRDSGRVAVGADRSRGLGLAIVESIADVHRGSLVLTPRPGGGLIAELGLVVAAAERTNPPTPKGEPSMPAGSSVSR